MEEDCKVSNNNHRAVENPEQLYPPLRNGTKENNEPCEHMALTSNDNTQNGHKSPLHQLNGVANQIDGYEDQDIETQCGWGSSTPQWLKKFASKQGFLAVFCTAWVIQGMYHTYFVSAITTIEKLFQIQSKITGTIMSATEIGQIGSSLLLTYYGGQGHRPKWIAGGIVLFAISAFTCSLPHFIYGQDLIHANNMPGNTKAPVVCNALKNPFFSNNTSQQLYEECFQENLATGTQQIQPSVTNIVLALFFISLLGVGMGQTAVYTLGIPYIDDNVASKESPLYFAITIGVRILGPAFGFIVGSLCTSVYADLSVDPQFDLNDPRWVGAWWLGLVIIAGLLFLAALAMFAFPKRLPHAKPLQRQRPKKVQNVEAGKHPSIKDFPKTVKRLLKNDILMFRTASSVLHLLPIAGLYTFLPKYLESQFRLPTPTANMISGIGGILVMGIGIVISGIFILRVKPNARFVAGWIAFTAIVYSLGMGLLMFIGCPMTEFAGQDSIKSIDPLDFSSCNSTACACDKNIFRPVCGDDNLTYLSPCHAGCKSEGYNYEKNITEYTGCMCLEKYNATSSVDEYGNDVMIYGNATIGYCGIACPNFYLYIVLFSIFVFIHSTSEVGSMLLILRCVDPKDKAMALGMIQFAIGLFGNVPCPIIYGAVVDSACMIWEYTCGEKGACRLYDADTFRMFFHGTTGALLLLAFFVDMIVWYKAGSINFAEEQPPFEEELVAIKMKGETD